MPELDLVVDGADEFDPELRLIKGGGARVGGEKVDNEAHVIAVGAEPVRVSAGRKHQGLLTSA